MKNCEGYQEWISRLLDGDLSESEEEELRSHMETCLNCAAVYAAFSSLSEALSGDLAEPPARLREKVMADVRREKLRVIRRPRRAAWTAAACLAVVLLAAYAAPRVLRMGSPAASSNASAQVTMAAEAAAESVMESYDSALEAEAEAPAEPAAPLPEPADNGAQRSDSFAADTAVTSAEAPVYSLDEEQSRTFLTLLQDASLPAESEGEPIRVLFWADGENCCALLYPQGDEILFRLEDGSRSGVLLCNPEELWTLLG